MTRPIRRILLFALGFAVLALLVWWRLQPEVYEVRVVTVEVGLVERLATNNRAGSVKARRRARLSPEVGGRVVELPFRKGDRVTAGALLLALDSTLERAQLEAARRELSAVQADRERLCLGAERASREVARYRRLAEERLVSEDLFDRVVTAEREARAACRAAEAAVERAEASVALAKAALAKRELRAPFAGVLAEVASELGEWVTPAPPAVPVPPIFDLVDPTSTYISLPMDEVDAALLRPGLPARITVDSHPGRTFLGRVVRVAPVVSELELQNRTIEVEVELDSLAEAQSLLAGTSADGEVVLERREGVLRLPTTAILAGDRVLMVTQGKLVEQKVEKGLSNWQWTEVRSGLEAGMQVLAAVDREELRPGARVRVVGTVRP